MTEAPSSAAPLSASRPLSPHIGIYRWQISMFTSIMHRITGIGLVAGSLIIIAWIVGLAYYPDLINDARPYMHTWWAVGIMIALTFAYFYHFANGIRHLFWDIGKGFTLPVMNRSGIFVVLFTLIMTALTWVSLFKQGME